MQNRLKNLELQGFKTFASRTEFAFAGPITAIVGPNGSGKSNVADAIRWVLGEQSYSLLRAKKTDDMIFSGSEQRARAGMAQATIVFDNSDGWLPIDFVEVAITRRAYRDGQNEYFINSQKVRLKDVAELLAQSGLSERTYTIIGQGLVDAALSLKAEERRRLFEEAAGIGLHRARREESLKRLENTRRNLERVEDILAELQPRLRSLERQARRFQEYEQVKADLFVLLRDWYGYHWRREQHDLLGAQEVASRQEANLSRVRKKQLDLDQQMGNLRSKIQAQRETVNSLNHQMSELHAQREHASRDMVILDERERSLISQQQNIQDELNRQNEEQALEKEHLESTELEEAYFLSEQEEAARQLDAARHAFQERQVERQLAEKALQDARQAFGALTGRQSYLSARLSERKGQGERLLSQVRETEKNLIVSEDELATSEKRLQVSIKQQGQAESARRAAESALQAHLAQQANLEADRKKIVDELTAIQARYTRLNAQSEVLEQAEKSLIGYASGARLLLQASQQSQLRGAAGALSSQLDVPTEIETAIAAVLGEYLDAVVLREQDGVEDALRLLSGQSARGIVLPLPSILNSEQNLPAGWGDGLPGLNGIAAHLVRTEPDIKPVVDLLLGNVVIVADRSAANTAIERLRNAGYDGKVVTLRGEVFHAHGPVIAGLDSKPGILSRVRERKDLHTRLAELQQQTDVIEKRLANTNEILNGLLANEPDLRKSLHMVEEAEKAAINSHNQDELAVEKARRSVLWNKEQISRLRAEIEHADSETEKMNAELAQLEAEIAKGREAIRTQNANLATLEIDELQSQLAHWTTRAAVAQQAIEDVQKRRIDRQSALEKSIRNLASLQGRLGDIQKQIQATVEEKKTTAQTEKELAQGIDELYKVLRPAEDSLQGLEQGHNQLQADDAESRATLSQAEHLNAQAKITLARRQEGLESLRHRIEDDFGLVAFKYAEEISGPTPLPLDGMVEQLPVILEIPPDLEENIRRQRAQLRRIGPINPDAHTEYVEVKERYEFLTSQVADLKQAELDIREVITELDMLMEREFRRTFDNVAREFRQSFSRLFDGGSARLVLTSPEDLTETGIDIEARLPGRREQGLSLLSGGERSLTASALVFALLKVSPTPFCLLDEVDAMLDEANVGRFRDLLHELSENTQFIVVTHNRNTVQVADVIYGVTMGVDSTSQVISLKLDQVSQVVE